MDEPEGMRAPIRTAQATYEWGDYKLEIHNPEVTNGTLTLHRLKNYDQRDERSQMTTIQIPLAEAEDVIRLMRHALESRGF